MRKSPASSPAETKSEAWFEVELRVAPVAKEAVIHQLFEWGAQGLAEDDFDENSVLRAYFKNEQRQVVEEELDFFLSQIGRHFPETRNPDVQLSPVDDEDWAETHKRFYPAQKLTRLFFLKPTWDTSTAVPEGMLPLILEPGQAFGTGLHASTRLCLRLLEYFVELHARPDRIRALDVGTGSGILAMALGKLGVQSVLGIDNDPIALEVADKNIHANESDNVQLSDMPLEELEGEFEIIVSNILLETHRELAAHYRRLIVPRGQLIVSGLLAHQKAEIVEVFRLEGFTLEASESSEDWIALAFSVNDTVSN